MSKCTIPAGIDQNVRTSQNECPFGSPEGKGGPGTTSRIYRSDKKDDLLKFIDDSIVQQVDVESHRKAVLDQSLLEHYLKYDTGVTDDIGQTALHLAVMWCDVQTVQRLLEAGFKPDQADTSGMTPVHCCSLLGSLDVFQCLPEETSTLPEENSGKCALHFAAMSGNMDIVRHIVQSGGDIEIQDNFGQTPVVTGALYSQPQSCNYLVEQGARADVRDKSEVPAVVVVNAKYNGLTLNMLDRYVENDVYTNKLKVDVSFMLSKPSEDTKKSSAGDITPYEILVNMSKNITSHITVRCLTDKKWKMYGRRVFYFRFLVYLFFNIYWTAFYALPLNKMKDFSGKKALGYFLMVFGTLLLIFSALHLVYLIRRGRKRGQVLDKMSKSRYNFEKSTSNHLTTTYFEEISKMRAKLSKSLMGKFGLQSGNMILVLIHVALFVQGIIKSERLANGTGTDDSTIFLATALVNAVVLLVIWARLFFECQVHSAIGKFVVFIQEIFKDVAMVAAVFVFLYIPNLAIFYYTVYRFDDDADWYDIPFFVLRMAVVDYDYDKGKEITSKESLDWWWDIYSCMWLFLASVVILNLFIALMSDRYATLGARARTIVALSRAEYIAQIDMLLSKGQVKRYNETLAGGNSVTSIPIEEEQTDQECALQKKFDGLESKIDALSKLIDELNRSQRTNLFIEPNEL